MKLKNYLILFIALFCLQSVAQDNNRLFLTYCNGGSPMIFIKENYISIQRLEEKYKQVGIIIGGGYKLWQNVQDGNVFFDLPENLKDGLYKVDIYLGKVASEDSYSGSSYIDKGFYIRAKNGEVKLEVNKYVLENNKEFINRPYYKDFITRAEKDIQADDETICELSRKITKGLKTDYDKVLAIHDWVAKHIYYDFDAYRSGKTVCDAVTVLTSRRSVCQGYANLSAALLRSLEIPCSVVSGYALGISSSGEWDNVSLNSDSNHAWNFAYPDNRLVIFDATWDSFLRYENRKYTAKTSDELSESELDLIHSGKGTTIMPERRYFHLTEEGLSIDHRITSVPKPTE